MLRLAQIGHSLSTRNERAAADFGLGRYSLPCIAEARIGELKQTVRSLGYPYCPDSARERALSADTVRQPTLTLAALMRMRITILNPRILLKAAHAEGIQRRGAKI